MVEHRHLGVRQTRFPKGLKPFSDYVHGRGMKLITWFEPERVGGAPSWLRANYPEWLLGERQNP